MVLLLSYNEPKYDIQESVWTSVVGLCRNHKIDVFDGHPNYMMSSLIHGAIDSLKRPFSTILHEI